MKEETACGRFASFRGLRDGCKSGLSRVIPNIYITVPRLLPASFFRREFGSVREGRIVACSKTVVPPIGRSRSIYWGVQLELSRIVSCRGCTTHEICRSMFHLQRIQGTVLLLTILLPK